MRNMVYRSEPVLAVLFWFLLCQACSGKSGASKDALADRAVDRDSSVEQDARQDSAMEASVPDAYVPPECTDPLPSEEIVQGEHYRLPYYPKYGSSGLSWSDTQVVYSDWRCPNDAPSMDDLYLFDMETLQETLMVSRYEAQVCCSVWGTSMVYVDASYWDPEDPLNDQRSELILRDLLTQQETRLTDSNSSKVFSKYNGAQVLFLQDDFTEPENQFTTLRLLDIASGDEVILDTEESGFQEAVSAWDISEEYVTWRASSPLEPPGSWDVWLYHIPTGITSQLHLSSHMVLRSLVSVNWVVWGENRTGQWGVYAKDLPGGLEMEVASGAHDKIPMGLNGDLATWFEFERSGCEFPCSSYDLVIGDLETGVQRRLTSEPRYWGVGKPTCRWLFYTEHENQERFRLYAWDLVAAGVLDPNNCCVIPCDPEIEQCEMLTWQGSP